AGADAFDLRLERREPLLLNGRALLGGGARLGGGHEIGLHLLVPGEQRLVDGAAPEPADDTREDGEVDELEGELAEIEGRLLGLVTAAVLGGVVRLGEGRLGALVDLALGARGRGEQEHRGGDRGERARAPHADTSRPRILRAACTPTSEAVCWSLARSDCSVA